MQLHWISSMLTNPSKDLHLLRTLGQMSITTSEFCQIIGRMRLYQALTPNQQKRLPRLLLGDSQINAACRAFVSDANFKSTGDSITGWQLLNLLNGSVKSSYIDNFLERNLNCTEFVQGIQRAKLGDSEYAWFLGWVDCWLREERAAIQLVVLSLYLPAY